MSLKIGYTLHFKFLQVKQSIVSTIESICNGYMKRDQSCQHDNASAHLALSFRQFCTKNQITALPQPPLSPHLPPCGFYYFGEIKQTCQRNCRTLQKKLSCSESNLIFFNYSAYKLLVFVSSRLIFTYRAADCAPTVLRSS